MNVQSHEIFQIQLLKINPVSILRIFINPHFWVIAILIAIITIVYYNSFPELEIKWFAIWKFRLAEFSLHIIGSLYYLPIIYAAIVFGLGGLIGIWMVSMAIITPKVIYYTYYSSYLLGNLMFLIIPVVMGLLIILAFKWMEKERKIFFEREQEREEYMSQVLKAQEDERKRISQELHDDTIQTLIAISDRMQHLLYREGEKIPPHIIQQIDSYNNSILQVSEDLRRISIDLRPSILDNVGLVEAIRWLVDELDEKGVKTNLMINGTKRALSSERDVHVFRFIQESLNNIKGHAEATSVVVQLDYNPNTLKVTIYDNGKGFVLPEVINKLPIKGKLGIIGLQERARLLNGNFSISSQPGEGTLVSMEFKV